MSKDEAKRASQQTENHTEKPIGQDTSREDFDTQAFLPNGATLPEADLRSGAVFGDYELLSEVARGGMGVVFQAKQRSLNRIVALKMILAGQLASEEDLQRFRAEAEAAAHLDHPGIVPIYEVGEHAGQQFFSMGFVRGQSLANKIHDGPLPPKEAAKLVKAVAKAVAYAHAQGVIHRDLKPGNVLLKDRGPRVEGQVQESSSSDSQHSVLDSQPMITDFGLAKRVEGESDLTATGQILGTPSYMPPEQASGEADRMGATADIYSLGAVLYACLVGRPPFQSANAIETLLQVLEQEPVPPRQLNAGVPRDLETICLKCLQKEPRARYASAAELSAELDRFLKDEPIIARPLSAPARGWRWCRRNPVVASLSAALIVVFLAAFVSVTRLWLVADARREQVLTERDEVDRQRLRAEENFQLARKAVDEYFTKVSEDELLRARLFPLRKELLEAALRFYERFVAQHADDAELGEEYSIAMLRVAQITNEIGEKEKALTGYANARKRWQDHVQEKPDDVAALRHLALCHYNIALVLLDLERHGEAGESMQQAVKIRSKLAEQQPSDHQAQSDYADAINGLALIWTKSYKPEQAIPQLQSGIELAKQLVERNPDDAHVQHRLGGMLNNLAESQMMLRRVEDSHQSLLAAVRHQRAAPARSPEEEEYQQFLANHLFGLGSLHLQMGKPQEALAHYGEARKLYERLVQSNPALTSRQVSLARVCLRLASLELTLTSGQTDEAQRLFERTAAILEPLDAFKLPNTHDYLAQTYHSLAKIHWSAGRLDQALDMFQRALRLAESALEHDPLNQISGRKNIAVCRVYIGKLLQVLNRNDDAEQMLLVAHGLYNQLNAEIPDDAAVQQFLGECANGLGLMYTNSNRLDEAQPMLRQAVELHTSLAAQFPQNADHSVSAGGALCNLGNVFVRSKQSQQALPYYEKATGYLEPMLADRQYGPVARQYLITTLTNQNSALVAQEQFEQARLACNRLAEFDTGANRAHWKIRSTWLLVRSDEYWQAATELTSFVRDERLSARDQYNAACVLSLCVGAVKGDTEIPDDEKQRLLEQYGDTAVTLLKRALQNGLSNPEQIKTDDDLTPLKSREDFLELLEAPGVQ